MSRVKKQKSMGYYNSGALDNDNHVSVVSLTNVIMALIARLVGIGFLLVGLWVGIQVINEAWNLYEDPRRVERFAVAIERGSNVDKLITPRKKTALNEDDAALQRPAFASPERMQTNSLDNHQTIGGIDNFRPSYFLAWVVILLLFLLIGRLSIWAMRTGGELALYDMHVKHFAKELLREARSGRRAGDGTG